MVQATFRDSFNVLSLQIMEQETIDYTLATDFSNENYSFSGQVL